MGQHCRVCSSPQRAQIDLELVGGKESNGAVASRHQLSTDSVRRHRINHLSAALVKVAAERRALESATGAYVSVLDRLESLAERIDSFIGMAESKGSIVGGAAVLREMRATLETIAKITGELDERPSLTVNLLSSPEVVELQRRILGALSAYPDARIAVAEAIDVEFEELPA